MLLASGDLNSTSLHWFLVIVDMPRLAIDVDDDSDSSDGNDEDIKSNETGSDSDAPQAELGEAHKHLKP